MFLERVIGLCSAPKQSVLNIFNQVCHISIAYLLYIEIYIISPGDTVHGGVPEVIFKMKGLESLDLSYTGINCLPDIANELFTLQTLNLEHCPFLESVSGNLGLLPNLRSKFR